MESILFFFFATFIAAVVVMIRNGLIHALVNWIQNVLLVGPDVNNPDFLCKVIRDNDTDYINVAFKESARFDVHNSSGTTPLHTAVHVGNKQLVNRIVKDANVDVNFKDRLGNTALVIACGDKNYDMISFLLSLGAEVEIPGTKIESCLFIAVATNDVKMLKLLLNARSGLDLHCVNVLGESLWGAAVQLEYTEIIKLFFEYDKQSINGYDLKRDMTPLMVAANKGLINMVNLLLSLGADPNAPNSAGNTALHPAVCVENAKVVDILLKHGADINSANFLGMTPLFFAVPLETPNMLRFLITHGANVNATVKDHTPLMYAAEIGNLESVKVLLNAVAWDSSVEKNCSAAAEIAFIAGHKEVDNYINDFIKTKKQE